MWLKAIATLFILLVLDGIWLTVNKSGYGNLVQRVQGSPIQLNMYGAFFSYACIFLAITLYVLPIVEREEGSKFLNSLKYGGILGFVIYGTFNFTNICIFRNYDVKMALKDTAWGVTLFTLTTWVVTSLFAPKPLFTVTFSPKV